MTDASQDSRAPQHGEALQQCLYVHRRCTEGQQRMCQSLARVCHAVAWMLAAVATLLFAAVAVMDLLLGPLLNVFNLLCAQCHNGLYAHLLVTCRAPIMGAGYYAPLTQWSK